MKKTGNLIQASLLIISLIISSCGIIDQNVRARKNLAKCKYDIKKVEFKELLFSDFIAFGKGDFIDINLEKALKLLAKNLPKIKSKNFKIKINHVKFDIHLKIKNTTNHEVALDHVEGELFIDNSKIINIKHDKFTRINPGKSLVEIIKVKFPFDEMEFKLKKPKTITIAAKVYVNIMMGKYTLKTPFEVKIKKSFPVPYKIIEKIIEKKKEAIKKILIKKIEQKLKKGVKKKIKKGVKGKIKKLKKLLR